MQAFTGPPLAALARPRHRPANDPRVAGEHTSTYSQGYLNGGVETGLRAAREVLQALGRRVRPVVEAAR